MRIVFYANAEVEGRLKMSNRAYRHQVQRADFRLAAKRNLAESRLDKVEAERRGKRHIAGAARGDPLPAAIRILQRHRDSGKRRETPHRKFPVYVAIVRAGTEASHYNPVPVWRWYCRGSPEKGELKSPAPDAVAAYIAECGFWEFTQSSF